MIDTISFLLPDGLPPKGIDHRVAENRYSEMALPGSLKGIGEDRVASGKSSYDDPGERDAIMNEERYATRQTIPQEQMIRGLMRGRFNAGLG
jgi:hypothetical protein